MPFTWEPAEPLENQKHKFNTSPCELWAHIPQWGKTGINAKSYWKMHVNMNNLLVTISRGAHCSNWAVQRPILWTQRNVDMDVLWGVRRSQIRSILGGRIQQFTIRVQNSTPATDDKVVSSYKQESSIGCCFANVSLRTSGSSLFKASRDQRCDHQSLTQVQASTLLLLHKHRDSNNRWEQESTSNVFHSITHINPQLSTQHYVHRTKQTFKSIKTSTSSCRD